MCQLGRAGYNGFFLQSYSHLAYLDYRRVHFCPFSSPLSSRWWHVTSSLFSRYKLLFLPPPKPVP